MQTKVNFYLLLRTIRNGMNIKVSNCLKEESVPTEVHRSNIEEDKIGESQPFQERSLCHLSV